MSYDAPSSGSHKLLFYFMRFAPSKTNHFVRDLYHHKLIDSSDLDMLIITTFHYGVCSNACMDTTLA